MKMINKDDIIQTVRGAFKEYILARGILGMKPGRQAEKIMWQQFLKGLEWRVDELIKKNEKN